jgi:hypothetical protein
MILHMPAADDGRFLQWLREEADLSFAPERLPAEIRARAILGTSVATTSNRAGVFRAVERAKSLTSVGVIDAPRLAVFNGRPASVRIGDDFVLPLKTIGHDPVTVRLQGGWHIHVWPVVIPDQQRIAIALRVRDSELKQFEPSVVEFSAEARAFAHVAVDGVAVIRTPSTWNEILARKEKTRSGQKITSVKVVREATKPLEDRKMWLYLIARAEIMAGDQSLPADELAEQRSPG